MPGTSVVTHSVSEFLSRLASGRLGPRSARSGSLIVSPQHMPSLPPLGSTRVVTLLLLPHGLYVFFFSQQASSVPLLLETATFLGNVQVYQERVAVLFSPCPSSASHSCRRECHPCAQRPVPEGTWAQAGILNSL